MTRTPYLLPQVRWGQRLGDFTVEDDLVIRNPYIGSTMACYVGELCLEKGVSREEQDEWSLRSQQHWFEAQQAGRFDEELLPIELEGKRGKLLLDRDEHPRPETTMATLAKLETVYGSPTVTAGNASGLADGAAAVMLTSSEVVQRQKLPVLAKILGYTMVCGEPRESAALPGVAIKKILNMLNLKLNDIKLIEVNEAFAAMPMATIPLFIFMAELVSFGGLARNLFDACVKITGRIPGGVAIATILANAGFRAMSGSSLAAAGAMSSVAMPELRRNGYKDPIAAGVIAVAGTLAIMIPPSIPLVIYGITTETSIGKLLIAGIVPGLLTTLMYSIGVITWGKLQPNTIPSGKSYTWKEKLGVITSTLGLFNYCGLYHV